MAIKKKGLGKGLDAIFMDNITEEKKNTVTLNLSSIIPNKSQPRKDFDQKSILDLADSISKHGILQPLLVRPLPTGNYQIIAGERRFRASKIANLTEVPVLIKDLSDKEAMELALIENLQRKDLSPVEEAKGYKVLLEIYNLTQEDISNSIGKSRPYITNSLRLLSLPEDVLTMLDKGKITPGHARTILSLKEKDNMIKIANLVYEQGISVRELEKIIKKLNHNETFKDKINTEKNEETIFYNQIELSLNQYLRRKVKVKRKENSKKGILEIEFYNKEDLTDMAKRLSNEKTY